MYRQLQVLPNKRSDWSSPSTTRDVFGVETRSHPEHLTYVLQSRPSCKWRRLGWTNGGTGIRHGETVVVWDWVHQAHSLPHGLHDTVGRPSFPSLTAFAVRSGTRVDR